MFFSMFLCLCGFPNFGGYGNHLERLVWALSLEPGICCICTSNKFQVDANSASLMVPWPHWEFQSMFLCCLGFLLCLFCLPKIKHIMPNSSLCFSINYHNNKVHELSFACWYTILILSLVLVLLFLLAFWLYS